MIGDTGLTATRKTCTRFLTLIRDELRFLSRSRRCRFVALLYTVFTLLPLLLYLWIRSRLVFTWPIGAVDVVSYVFLERSIFLFLVIALVHDLLTRGDREGWQESFATLPVGELTWFLGRSAGRFLWLLAILIFPWIAGWGVAGLWAGRLLDPLPFLAAFLEEPLLSLLMMFPLAVLAGCIGNSLIGAVVTFFTAMIFLAFASPSLPGTFFSNAHAGSLQSLGYLTMLLFMGSEFDTYQFLGYATDPGRGWPAWGVSGNSIRATGIAFFLWPLYFLAGPYLVRLRRHAGRWVLRIPGIPTFSRGLAEILDQSRPVIPESRAAARVSIISGLLLLGGAGWMMVSWAEIRGREMALFSSQYSEVKNTTWPDRFLPQERHLDIRLEESGELHGLVTLSGTAQARPGRPLPFSLAYGIKVLKVLDDQGRPLTWQRDLHRLWIVPRDRDTKRLEITFAGQPRKHDDISKYKDFQDYGPGYWNFFNPILKTAAQSGQRQSFLDLTGLSWAPEPLGNLNPGADFGGRIPCCGNTSLTFRLPSRLIPVPLPGHWETTNDGNVTVAHWQGISFFLPPLQAGFFQIVSRPGRPSISIVTSSPGTDLECFINHFLKVWHTRSGESEVDQIVIQSRHSDRPWLYSSSPSRFLGLLDTELPVHNLPGLIYLADESINIRTLSSLPEWLENRLNNQ